MASISAIAGAYRPTATSSTASATRPGIPSSLATASPSQGKNGSDTVSVSAAALQQQLGALQSQIQSISGNTQLCAQTKAQTLAPLYIKAEGLQSLVSLASATVQS